MNTETRVGLFVLMAVGIFVYMNFQIGIIRMDRGDYNRYTIYFDDISGLARKADVKISGVKVGWVDKIELLQDESKVQIIAMVDRAYSVHKDAYGVIRQDGLIGVKFVEIVTGDPGMPKLTSGETLGEPSTPAVSVDELLKKFKVIANNVEEITASLKDAVGGDVGRDRLTNALDNFSDAAKSISTFSSSLQRAMDSNEHKIDAIFSDLEVLVSDMRDNLGPLGSDLRRMSAKLEDEVLPSFKHSVERVASIVDRDFGRVATRLESAADSVESTVLEARGGFRSLGSIAEKIDAGKGVIGKLVNEEETYKDLKTAIQGVRNYISKIDSLDIIIDSHFESMYRPAENFGMFTNSKGYFDVKVYPIEDYFYMFQLVTSRKGWVEREVVDREWYNASGDKLDQSIFEGTNWAAHDTFAFAPEEHITRRKRNSTKFGFQFGKTFSDLTFRFGLFEGTAGIGIDYEFPINSENLRWITSIEAFDMNGSNRLNDTRPHLKWLNRMYLFKNFYLAFGADDFISKGNANGFFGIGITFTDDDIKYLASRISFK